MNAMALGRFGAEVPRVARPDFAPTNLTELVLGVRVMELRHELIDRQPPRPGLDVRGAWRRNAIELVAEDDDRARERDDADDRADDQAQPEMDLEEPSPCRRPTRGANEGHVVRTPRSPTTPPTAAGRAATPSTTPNRRRFRPARCPFEGRWSAAAAPSISRRGPRPNTRG